MQQTFTLPVTPTIKSASLYGSLTARLIAFLVDTTLLVFSYSFVLYGISDTPQLYSWENVFRDGDTLNQLLAVGKLVFYNPYFPVLHWLYYTVLQSSQKQATVGKYTLGLRVTDLRGKRISFAHANLRYFGKLLSMVPVCLGFLLLLSTRRKQTLHDYLSRTVVVTD